MDMQLLKEKFARLGARVRVNGKADRLAIDIRHDKAGEYFHVDMPRRQPAWLDAIDVEPRQRHLLLMAADDQDGSPAGVKQRFLCGHDERSWFVAAIPEGRAASNVKEAMEALKPLAVRQSLARNRVRFRDRNRRRNDGFVRQGEWFFLPAPFVVINEATVLRNEPLRRSGGKPHWAEFLSRDGGEVVYVHRQTSQVLSVAQYMKAERRRGFRPDLWMVQRRNMQVYVRGRISHPDHKTIVLPFWHQVVMNTENQSLAMRSVAFID